MCLLDFDPYLAAYRVGDFEHSSVLTYLQQRAETEAHAWDISQTMKNRQSKVKKAAREWANKQIKQKQASLAQQTAEQTKADSINTTPISTSNHTSTLAHTSSPFTLDLAIPFSNDLITTLKFNDLLSRLSFTHVNVRKLEGELLMEEIVKMFSIFVSDIDEQHRLTATSAENSSTPSSTSSTSSSSSSSPTPDILRYDFEFHWSTERTKVRMASGVWNYDCILTVTPVRRKHHTHTETNNHATATHETKQDNMIQTKTEDSTSTASTVSPTTPSTTEVETTTTSSHTAHHEE